MCVCVCVCVCVSAADFQLLRGRDGPNVRAFAPHECVSVCKYIIIIDAIKSCKFVALTPAFVAIM